MSEPDRRLDLAADRLLPPDAGVRRIARALYDRTRRAPIVSPHGHVDAGLLLADAAFPDPTGLLVTPDHYVTRLLHASGVSLSTLGVGRQTADGPLPEPYARAAWRTLCAHWDVFRGTPVRWWLESQLGELFGVTVRPTSDTADALYDQVAEQLAAAEFRPRALFRRFGIEVLVTTNDPCDDLAAHAALAADPDWDGRVIPTFRPDRYLEPTAPGWRAAVGRLGEVADVDTGHYDGYVEALERRRRFFASHGATSADHSHLDAGTEPLAPEAATRIYAAALAGEATVAEATAFRRHMLLEMARMSCEDGLVMTLHSGVWRNHHPATAAAYGPDTGHDIPVQVELTRSLQPLLARYGTTPGFHLVLFTVDETVFSREIGPLAGFYPSVYAGAPWWFLDAPDAISRYRAAVTETAGFTKVSGFVDDTRAFCSIPARHDMSRRLDAAHLAGLVADHRLAEEEAAEVADALVGPQPRRVFKL